MMDNPERHWRHWLHKTQDKQNKNTGKKRHGPTKKLEMKPVFQVLTKDKQKPTVLFI